MKALVLLRRVLDTSLPLHIDYAAKLVKNDNSFLSPRIIHPTDRKALHLVRRGLGPRQPDIRAAGLGQDGAGALAWAAAAAGVRGLLLTGVAADDPAAASAGLARLLAYFRPDVLVLSDVGKDLPDTGLAWQVSERLGWPVLRNVTGMQPVPGTTEGLMAIARTPDGWQEAWRVETPCIVAVSDLAPAGGADYVPLGKLRWVRDHPELWLEEVDAGDLQNTAPQAELAPVPRPRHVDLPSADTPSYRRVDALLTAGAAVRGDAAARLIAGGPEECSQALLAILRPGDPA